MTNAKRRETLSASAQSVLQTLRSLGYQGEVIEFTESTRTAQEAADRAGCLLGQITKSLIFRGDTSGQGILVLTSGSNRVDEARLKEYAGESISRADPAFVRAVTGYAIGGVPPVGHAAPMQTYLDEDLTQYATIWAAAGTPNAIFELTPQQLQAWSGAKVCQVK